MGSNILHTKQMYEAMAHRNIGSAIRRDWYLTEEERALLDKWYVLRWTGQYYAGKFETAGAFLHGSIKHDGIFYDVKFYHCQQRDCIHAKQVTISFRRIKGATVGIALVRPFKEKHYG